MEEEGVNLNKFIYEWLKYVEKMYENNNKKNLTFSDLEFKDNFEIYLELKQIETTPKMKQLLINPNKFKRYLLKNETFRLCMLKDKENLTYPIYCKSNGFHKWTITKRKYPCLLNIIQYLEETFKFNNDDNSLINLYNKSLNMIED